MSIPLTDEMKAALDAAPDKPVPVRDDRTNREYVLVPADRYELLEAFADIDDEDDRAAWQAASLESLGRVEWDTDIPWGSADEPG